VRCYEDLSKAYLNIGKLDMALQFLQKIIQYAKQQTESIQGLDEVYFKMALIKGRLGNIPAALQAAEQGIVLNPNNQAGQQLKQQIRVLSNKYPKLSLAFLM